MAHYHIRWANGTWDWERHSTRAVAEQNAKALTRPSEKYTVEEVADNECPKCKPEGSVARSVGESQRPVTSDHYIVMMVECPTCKTKQKVHVAVTVGGAQTGNQTIPCINCNNHFKVAVPDKIFRGLFPA